MADRDVQIRISLHTADAQVAGRELAATLTASASAMEAALADAQAAVREVGQSAAGAAPGLDRMSDGMGDGAAEMSDMARAASVLDTALENVQVEVSDTGQALSTLGTKGGLVSGMFGEIRKEFGAAFSALKERDIRGLGDATARLGMAAGPLVAVAGGVAAVGGAISRVSMEVESQASDLSAITGIVGADLEALREAAVDSSLETGRAVTDQIEAYKLLASNIDIAAMGGIEGLQAMGAEVVTLAIAARVELATAADSVAATLNQFGLASGEGARVVNVLAAGAKFGAAEVADLADTLREAGTTAAGANVSLEQTVGASEVLAQSALKGAQAGTQLRNVISILDTEATKLANNGIAGVNLQGDGLTTTLQKLRPLLNDSAALTEVFGRENLNAARILITNADAVDRMTASVTGTNTAQEQAAIQADNLRGDLDRLRAAYEALLLEGSGLNQGFRELVQGMTLTLRWLHENWSAVETGTKVLIIASVAVGTFRATTLAAAAASRVMAAAEAARTAGTVSATGALGVARTAMLAFNVAVRANPVGILVSVLGAAASAMFLFRSRTAEATGALARQRQEVRDLAADIQTLSEQAARSRATDAQAMVEDLRAQMRATEAQQAALRAQRDSLNTDIRAGAVLDALQARVQASRIESQLARLDEQRTEIGRQMGLAILAVDRANERAAAAAAETAAAFTTPAPVVPATPAAADASSTTSASTSADQEKAQARQRQQRLTDYQRQAADAEQARVQAAADAAERISEIDAERLRMALSDEQQRRQAATDRYDAEAKAAQTAYERTTAAAETAHTRAVADARAGGQTREEIEAAVEAAGKERLAALAEAEGARDVALAEAALERDRVLSDLDARRAERLRQTAAEQLEAAERLSEAEAQRGEASMSEAEREAAAAERAWARRGRAARAAYDEAVRAANESGADQAEIDAALTAARIELDAELAEARLDHEEAVRAAQQRAHEEQMRRLQEAVAYVEQATGLAVQIMGGLSDRRVQQIEAEADAQLEALDERQAREIAAIRQRIEASAQGSAQRAAAEAALAALQEEHATAREAREEAYQQRVIQEKQRQARFERAQALFQIALQTAVAVMEAAPNVARMVAVGVLGGLQAGAVVAQPLPQYAEGTDHHVGGLAIVGERGPEVVSLPRGASVITNERTERLGAAYRALERATDRSAAMPPSAASAVDVHLHELIERQTRTLAERMDALVVRTAAVEEAVGQIDLHVGDEQIGMAARRDARNRRLVVTPFEDL